MYKYEDGIGEKIPMLINFLAIIVSAMIIAFVKGWELTLINLTSLPASLIALAIVSFVSITLIFYFLYNKKSLNKRPNLLFKIILKLWNFIPDLRRSETRLKTAIINFSSV